jgi:membrane protease YdiL (CAAX protease family)
MNSFSSDRVIGDRLRTGEALLFFFMILPVILFGGTLLQGWSLLKGTILTEWGLILLPTLAYLKLRGKNISRTLCINLPQRKYILASILLALSGVPIISELSVLQDLIFPIPPDFLEAMNEAFTLQEGESMLLALLAFSITPSICEEVLFRGVLLRGLMDRLGRAESIFFTGLLFGLFHLNIYRFLPTSIIGLIIAYLVVSSSSLITGILYHAVNNAVALTALNISYLQKYRWLYEESHIPLPILILSFAVFFYGISLLKTPAKVQLEFYENRRSK